MEDVTGQVALPVTQRAWPQKGPCGWGFDLASAQAGKTWLSRDEAVAWACAHEGPDALSIFSWWTLFLDCMTHGVVLPSIATDGGRVIARWVLARHHDRVQAFLDRYAVGSEALSGVREFLDDWADDYVRRHAPPLESRQTIGGPLGRRLMARLLRSRQPWDLNPNDQGVLQRIVSEWQQEAEETALANPRPEAGIVVRVSAVSVGEGLSIEVFSERDGQILAEEVAGWALRWAPWRRALGQGGVKSLALTPAEVDSFWRQEAPTLVEAGIRLELPRHWRHAELAVRGRIAMPPSGDQVLSLQQIAEVDWQIALDGDPLSLEEVRQLALATEPVVKVRNRWVVADQALVARARNLYERARQKKVRQEELLRMYLDDPLDGVQIDDGGWLQAALEALRQPLPVALPILGFNGTLRPYQVEGVQWLRQRMRLGLGALLADDMGLGKTVEVIAALADGASTWSDPVLLISPLSVVSNWEREFQRFFPAAEVKTHLGLARHSGPDFIRWAKGPVVILTTYDVLARDWEVLRQVHWSGVVADEAQHLKNHRTKRARALRQLTATWRIALTGTPVENRLGDLWAEMDVLNPGYLGSEAEFRQEFERPIARMHDQEAVDRLKRLLEPFVLRRVKTDPAIVPDLPDKVEIKEWTGITREQAALYQSVVDQLWAEIGGIRQKNPMARRGVILSALTQLKQVVNHPESFLGGSGPLKGRSGKLDRLEELLEAILGADERVVIFTQYVRMGELLKPYLARKFHTPVGFFHGGLQKMERDRMLSQLAEPDGPRILLASLKAGGVGLNLVHAQHVIHYDRWWNPAVEDQATDRVWRIGQTKLVSVHKLIARGTLEERIDRLIENKRRISDTVMAPMDSEKWLTELSDQQIRELVELGEDAWIAGD